MKIGDTVEYVTGKVDSGVIGVITGFWEGRAKVLSPSGHEWLLRKTTLRVLPSKPTSPRAVD